jgi:hypothetical protein
MEPITLAKKDLTLSLSETFELLMADDDETSTESG